MIVLVVTCNLGAFPILQSHGWSTAKPDGWSLFASTNPLLVVGCWHPRVRSITDHYQGSWATNHPWPFLNNWTIIHHMIDIDHHEMSLSDIWFTISWTTIVHQSFMIYHMINHYTESWIVETAHVNPSEGGPLLRSRKVPIRDCSPVVMQVGRSHEKPVLDLL